MLPAVHQKSPALPEALLLSNTPPCDRVMEVVTNAAMAWLQTAVRRDQDAGLLERSASSVSEREAVVTDSEMVGFL